ncbi:MAG: exodeoxyribonuclease VII small subunit [Gemmatimonadetes bacterium]|nr:exodeoxyribonuclease VII small subunit [Gemmatimonadota bacterium]
MPDEGAPVQGGGSGAPDDGDEASLENRIRRLEAIVAALDSDTLELEQALALFEEGVIHVRKAQEILAEAELKVEELIGRDGEEARPMESANGTDDD